ncbi:hypothetical protein D4764_17G0000250 [Takifugu flavidus]|uniref:Uncharacterized protein n=1 Tax=Takifugu flavidus TaxID=433684 RepID=A0A5C6NTD5_9TELE|nr:hypothetical protein D4764_17G0000250 [Takifugu flavidus]
MGSHSLFNFDRFPGRFVRDFIDLPKLGLNVSSHRPFAWFGVSWTKQPGSIRRSLNIPSCFVGVHLPARGRKAAPAHNASGLRPARNQAPHLESAYLRFLSGTALFKLFVFVVVGFPEKMAVRRSEGRLCDGTTPRTSVVAAHLALSSR